MVAAQQLGMYQKRARKNMREYPRVKSLRTIIRHDTRLPCYFCDAELVAVDFQDLSGAVKVQILVCELCDRSTF